MKKMLFSLTLLLSTQIFADQVDCNGAEKNYQEHINGLKRQCTKTSDCRADSLNWDPCANQVVHSDASITPQLSEALDDLAKICPRPAKPCPALMAKPICFDGLCENSYNLGSKKNKNITIQFNQNAMPLVNANVHLDADTGIRCVTAPCDSRRVVANFVTDKDGNIYLSAEKVISLMNDSKSNTIHQTVGPDGYSWNIDNVGYHGIDLTGLLVDTNKIHKIDFK